MYDNVDSEYLFKRINSGQDPSFSFQSVVPMGCYSTHILLSKGTTIVHLNQHSEVKECSFSLKHKNKESVATMMDLFPTFNCAFATMVHGMERLKSNQNTKYQDAVASDHFDRKAVLVLVIFQSDWFCIYNAKCIKLLNTLSRIQS